MVRNYKRKGTYNKWDEEQMKMAIKSVLLDSTSVRIASERFAVPFETLRRKVRLETLRSTLGDDDAMVHIAMSSCVGHRTILNADQEAAFVRRIVHLVNKGLGCTPGNIRKAAYKYVTANNISHPWGNSGVAGVDWFAAFMKRNPHLKELRKSVTKLKVRAEGVNKVKVIEFFDSLQSLYARIGVNTKPQCIYNVAETVFPIHSNHGKEGEQQGLGANVGLTGMEPLERAENVTVVAACNAAGEYIPPFVIFKGLQMQDEFKVNMPQGAQVVLSVSGFVNEEIFVQWLKFFQANRAEGQCVLILDGNEAHCSLEALEFCENHDIELLRVPPHKTLVLQPLHRMVFNPLETYYNEEATKHLHTMYSAGTELNAMKITKGTFGSIFKSAWERAAIPEDAVEGFSCTGIYPFKPDVIPKVTLLPFSLYFNELLSGEERQGIIPVLPRSSITNSHDLPSTSTAFSDAKRKLERTESFEPYQKKTKVQNEGDDNFLDDSESSILDDDNLGQDDSAT